MLTHQSPKEEIPYNLMSTIIFLGVVVGLPVFFYYLSPGWAFEPYALIPLIFGTWTFLREPSVKIKHRKMEMLSNKYPDLANLITSLPPYTNLRKPPAIMYIPTEVPEAFAFGTWRRNYIAVSEGAINRWNNPRTITSVITHEIAHISNGDIWKAGFCLHFLYWFFGVNIWVFIRTFPYSMFFRIYLPFRVSNGYTDLVTSLTLFILVFAIFLAVRILYRIKEYAADAFSARHIGTLDYAKAFVAPISKNNHDVYRNSGAITLYLRTMVSKAISFHPSSQARLAALQWPFYLMAELPSLLFVAGIFIGTATCYFLDLDTSFALTLVSQITCGFLLVTLLLDLQKPGRKLLMRPENYIANTVSLANGVALAFLVLVGVNNLLVNQNDGAYGFSMVIRHGVDLRDALFSSIDVLLLILFLAPALLLGFIFAAWLLMKVCSVNGTVWKPRLLSVVSVLPGIVLLDLYIMQWWEGQPIIYDKMKFLFPLYILWVVVVIVIWRLISRWQSRSNIEVV